MSTLLGILRFAVGASFSLVMGLAEMMTMLLAGRRGRIFHGIARFWARWVLIICGVRVRVSGLEHLDFLHTYVYVSNHASMFDIPCVVAGIPDQIRIVYKRELHVIPFFGWGLKWGAYIPIERASGASAMRSLEEAAQKIRNGASVLLYAEGTRTLDGRLQPFKRGAFNLAIRAGVRVVPLTINGSFRILQKHSLIIRPGTVHLILETPIAVEGQAGKEAERKLMDQVHAAIAKNYVDQS